MSNHFSFFLVTFIFKSFSSAFFFGKKPCFYYFDHPHFHHAAKRPKKKTPKMAVFLPYSVVEKIVSKIKNERGAKISRSRRQWSLMLDSPKPL